MQSKVNLFENFNLIPNSGKRDFAEENNLTHFYITISEKKKSLFGSAGWKKIGTFETNYKWDVHKGISYHKFDK